MPSAKDGIFYEGKEFPSTNPPQILQNTHLRRQIKMPYASKWIICTFEVYLLQGNILAIC